MIDDGELAELFRSAASDRGAPPAFDHSDVVTASRRITVRRRAAITGALGVLAVVGIGAAVVLPRSDDGAATASAPFAVTDDGATGRQAAPEAAVPPAGAQAADAVAGPLGPGNGPCADRQDPALRALVEQVLPEVVGAPAAATTDVCRPGGERGVSAEVVDGAATGLLTVSYLPPGTAVALVPGAVSAPTVSGGTVVVGSRPAVPGGAAPFAGSLVTVAAFLAQRV